MYRVLLGEQAKLSRESESRMIPRDSARYRRASVRRHNMPLGLPLRNGPGTHKSAGHLAAADRDRNQRNEV